MVYNIILNGDNMRNPSVQQVTTVIETLKIIEAMANIKGKFDMNEDQVKCGAPVCVAGWYLIAKHNVDFGDSFVTGCKLMAIDLGFDHCYELEQWARYNRNIWGNSDGHEMFYEWFAYNGLRRDSKNPMTDVIEHWISVRERLQEIENVSANV